MADRYFVETPIAGPRARLEGAEAHHLAHVMRARPGDLVTLFDGSGAEFPARVERVGRTAVELAVLAREEIDRELPRAVTLGVALPKGDRQKWLVEKAVELGAARLVPLSTTRAVAQPVNSALERLRRSVIEASKQCGRNRLMAIDPPCTWAEFLAATADDPWRLLAHPSEENGMNSVLRAHPAAPPLAQWPQSTLPVTFAIGPEGGFTDEEVATALAAGWQAVDLDRRILRVETAAIALLAWAALSSA